jgi:acyl-CoA thioesterase
MPEVAAPLDCRTRSELFAAAGLEEPATFPFWGNFECRPFGWVVDPDAWVPGAPESGGWYRFIGPTDPDPWIDGGRAVILVDTFTWPSACQAHADNPYIGPSLDLSVQLHHDVADSVWLLVRGVAPIAHRGTIGCTGQVWAPDGRLAGLGTGTLLCVPAPSR